jgi:hypothetical protein
MPAARHRLYGVGIALVLALGTGCGQTTASPIQSEDGGPPVTDGAPGVDGAASGTEGGSSHPDAALRDGGLGGTPDATNTYEDFSNSSNWDAIDLATVASLASPGPQVYWGAVFANGSLYLDPFSDFCVGYETTLPFYSTASWALIDLGSRYFGGVTDGRYVYFAPEGSSVARYDTTRDVSNIGNWVAFDVTNVSPAATFFNGAVFDGRHVYLVPAGLGQPPVVARYDTTASFGDVASWAVFDLSKTSPPGTAFFGGVFDGRYVYLVPLGSVVARYDTTRSFASAAAWTTFDVTAANPLATGFNSGVFDGRYVYLIPSIDQNRAPPPAHSLLVRYDTTAAFGAATSWQTVDVTTLTTSYNYANGRGFSGGAFDGRYLYLVPALSPFVARFDTGGSLGAPAAWSFFDTASVNRSAGAFNGAGFDGQYVYFVPGQAGTVMARFRSRTVPAIPAAMHGGSFF